jgi:heme-degrading monooxygenase HmoA
MMWARVSRFREPGDAIDKDVQESREIVTTKLQQMAGFQGIYYLADRDGGQTLAMTLWRDEQSMRASEQEADRIREDSTTRVGGEIVDVQRYEVVLQPSDFMSKAA